jgi:glucokinase
MILAGDIGGTNTRLALFDDDLGIVHHQQSFRNAGHASFEELVRAFLQGRNEKISRACFGVAGPVAKGEVTLTNLKWHLNETQLSRELSIERVRLINDLLAHAEGIARLTADQLVEIHPGDKNDGNKAVIAAGTGLGEAGILQDRLSGHHHAFASEGGHCDFGPRSPREIELLRYLLSRYPNASWERVLSGPGLKNIYDFLCTPDQLGPDAAIAGVSDVTPEAIGDAARAGASRAAVEALEMFIRFYGAESANLALKLLASGGVYIAGAIALKFLDQLRNDVFVKAFVQTGPDNIRQFLARIPVYVVNSPACALVGAANYASRM